MNRSPSFVPPPGRPRRSGPNKRDAFRLRALRALDKDFYDIKTLFDIESYIGYLQRVKYRRYDKARDAAIKYQKELDWRTSARNSYIAEKWIYGNMSKAAKSKTTKPAKVAMKVKKTHLNKDGTMKAEAKRRESNIIQFAKIAKALLAGEEVPGYTLIASHKADICDLVDKLLDLKDLPDFNVPMAVCKYKESP